MERITSLFNCILKEKRTPSELGTRVMINCFKQKGEAIERGNYRDLKLLEYTIKIFERIIEKETRKLIDISEMHAVWTYVWKREYRCHFYCTSTAQEMPWKKENPLIRLCRVEKSIRQSF